jgi:quinol monooxygenase YgiN
MNRQMDDMLARGAAPTRDGKGSATSRQDVMHAIYFRWKVAPGHERKFEHAWLELTELVRDERGGLGSRLHRCTDGHYFAYAQWPSELVWAAQAGPTARMVELRNRMRGFAELVDGPLRGDVVADLLASAAPG